MKMDFAFLTVAEIICFLLVLTWQNITIVVKSKSRTKMGRAGSGPEFHVQSLHCGPGWVGSRKLDPSPTLTCCHARGVVAWDLGHEPLNFDQVPNFETWFNPLECRGNYTATSNNMKLVHWPLMGGLLHLVQRGGDWAGPQPAQAPPRCTKCNSPPIDGQCTNRHIAVRCSTSFNVPMG